MRQGRILILLGLIATHSTAGSASAMGAAPYTDTQACVQDVDPAALSKGGMKAVGSVQDAGNITLMEFEGDYARGKQPLRLGDIIARPHTHCGLPSAILE